LKLRICLGLLLIATVIALMGATHLSAARLDSDAVLFTAAPTYLPLAWVDGGERFPAGAAIYYKDVKSTRKLFPDFAQSADANVSFDGTKMLFSGKKLGSDPWQVWEASFTDLAPKQITRSSVDAIRPFYLPGDRLVYSTKQNGKSVLVNASLDGQGQQQISFGATNLVATDVLRDGRILVNATYSGRSENTPEIFAVYSDGSGFESIRCDHAPVRYAGRQLSSGDVVFTHGSKLSIFSSPLAAEQTTPLPSADYAGDIAETTSHEWIVATRANGNAKYTLRLAKPHSAISTPYASMPSQNLVQPVVRAARPTPKKHPSALHDWKFANLLALNVYTSKFDLLPGSVATVHVYTQEGNGAESLLGSAPIETDGSFFVRVPGDVPIKFELLNAKGDVLQREKGWFWARSGEQRICVGCHAGPERAPDNAVPMVLEKSVEPVNMTTTHSAQTGGH